MPISFGLFFQQLLRKASARFPRAFLALRATIFRTEFRSSRLGVHLFNHEIQDCLDLSGAQFENVKKLRGAVPRALCAKNVRVL